MVIELVLERVPGAACAVTARAPALDHEVGDHPVEHEAVVVPVPGELREVRHRLRSVLVEELELDRPLARGHDRRGHGTDASSTGEGRAVPPSGWFVAAGSLPFRS